MQTQGQDRADGRARDHRIQKTGNLLDGQGRLREAGFACAPPFLYNREDIAAPAWRIKDWDYYLVNDGDYALALTFSDLGERHGLRRADVQDHERGRALHLRLLPPAAPLLPRRHQLVELPLPRRVAPCGRRRAGPPALVLHGAL